MRMKFDCRSSFAYRFYLSALTFFWVASLFFFTSFAVAQNSDEAPSPGRTLPPAEQIFPDSTKGFVTIRNMETLETEWRKTQVGQLMNDPIMDAFKKDFQAQMAKRMEDRFGFTLDEIRALPSGQVAAGMIAIPGQTPGYVVTLDVADRQKETADYLNRLSEKLQKAGTRRQVEKYKDGEIIIFTFPPPKQPVQTPGEQRPIVASPSRNAFYLLKDGNLLISDQSHLVKLIYDRLNAVSTNTTPTGKALADVEDFQNVMKRCYDDSTEGSEPLIRWYLEPLNYGESIRMLMRGPVVEKRRNKPSVFTILKNQGFDAIRGIGGIVNLKTENKEVVYRVFVRAKKPFRLAMRMLSFPDGTNFTPPNWMPTDLARCSTFFVEPLTIFDNFGTLFDSLVMQGEEGVWDDILKGLKEAEDGPQIDIREEVVALLGQRVLGMSKYQLPITPESECMIVAVELKENKEDGMKNALEKLFGDDTEMQRTDYKSYILWHRIPADDIILPETNLEGVPNLVASPPSARRRQAEAEEEKDAPPMFPGVTLTVAKGCLFVGTNFEYTKTILDRLETALAKEELSSIGGEAEYKEVDRIFADMGITNKPHFMQFFARTDETIRPTYELIRKGQMPQSQAILGKAINALFVSEEDKENGAGLRQQAIDGTNLPEFELIRKYLGPAGIYGATEEDGFFFKGFLLEKKAENEIGPGRKIEGTVTQDGQPLAGKALSGRIVFADDGSPLEVGTICFATDTFQARGAINKDGKYVVGALAEKGLPPGNYRVYIAGATREIGQDEDGNPIIETIIEEKYTKPETSGLQIEIDETIGVFDIVVDRAPKDTETN